MNLNAEQVSILEHTVYRAAGRRYCGSSKDMQKLVEAGLMKSLGKVGWCPDEFFTITEQGEKVLEEMEKKNDK